MPSHSVFVPGVPIPEGSTTAYVTAGGHATTTHANRRALLPWRAEIHALVRQVIGHRIAYPAEPVTVRVWFVMPRPAAEPKRRTRPHARRPDLDKLARAVLDALTGIVYTDDSQVHRLLAHKRTAREGEQPGALIEWDTP